MKIENTTDIIISVMGRVVIPLTSLTTPHYCASTKPVPGFPTSYGVNSGAPEGGEVHDIVGITLYAA